MICYMLDLKMIIFAMCGGVFQTIFPYNGTCFETLLHVLFLIGFNYLLTVVNVAS